jgi:hypothetical protein
VRHRAFRFLLLSLITIWFGVVVPLHPRGAIKLGGGECGGSSFKTCCHADKTGGGDSKPKPAGPQCAICHFLATLDLPADIGMDVPPLGLVEQIEPPAPQAAPVIAYLSPASERGPPIA